MKESDLIPPRMPKEWETTRKSGFQTESQQPSPSMQNHQASTMSRWGGGPQAPPGCRLGSRTTGDAAHCLAGPSRQPGRQRLGRRAAQFVQSLLQQGGSGDAPGGEGELRGARLQPVGVGRLWTGRPRGIHGAHRGCVLRFLWLVLCWKRQKSGKLSAGFIESRPLWGRLSQGLGFLGRGHRG